MTKLLASLPLWQRYVIAVQRYNPYKWYLYYRTSNVNANQIELSTPAEVSQDAAQDTASN